MSWLHNTKQKAKNMNLNFLNFFTKKNYFGAIQNSYVLE